LTKSLIRLFINQIEQDLPFILVHKYGNYFFKSLIMSSSPTQRVRVIKAVQGSLASACFNSFGIHPIQSLLSLQLTVEEEIIVREALKGKIMDLSMVYYLPE
jgi:hypothetical protein